MRADEFTRKAKRNSKIYLDMDGVLADFFAEYAKLAGVKTYRDIPPAKADPILDSLAGTDFFGRLPKFPTTNALVKLALSYAGSYSICSSPLRGDFENTEYWKRVWIKGNLNPQPSTIEITTNKPQHAVTNGVPNILIDDKGSNVRAWIAAGGIGIKYQADEDSLDKVKKALDSIYCEVKDTCDWDDEELPPAMEAWSDKYKKSINCNNPKGFSQKAHCDGRKKKVKEMSHRDAVKLLKKHHYHLDRQHGSHEVWKDEEGHSFALPHKHHGKDIAKGVEHALKKEITHENAESSGYKEIEFICVNPEYPDATDPKLQKQMYLGLKKIPNVIPLLQDWDEYSEGQKSLSAIYKDKESRQKIFALAKQLGVEIDLERPVSDDYIDRAIRGEHEGQQGVTENFADGKKPGRKGLAKRMGVDCSKSETALRKIAKNSTGEKQRMAHWCANMKSGKKK